MNMPKNLKKMRYLLVMGFIALVLYPSSGHGAQDLIKSNETILNLSKSVNSKEQLAHALSRYDQNNVSELRLNDNLLTRECAPIITDFIKRHPELHNIDLSGNVFSARGWSDLSQSLLQLPLLAKLSLGVLILKPKTEYNYFFQHLLAKTSLVKLEVRNISKKNFNLFLEKISKNETLKTLILSDMKLTLHQFEQLGVLLNNHPSLEKLILCPIKIIDLNGSSKPIQQPELSAGKKLIFSLK